MGCRNCTFDVGGHIVWSLLPVFIGVTFWYRSVHPLLQIVKYGGVGILLNDKTGRGVANVDGRQSFLNPEM